MTEWTLIDPFVLTKPTVCLIGMAETTRDLAPWDDPNVEIWGINESYARRNKAQKKEPRNKDEVRPPYVRRWDRWFQLHPSWDYSRPDNFNHENHPHWLVGREGRCMVCGGHGKLKTSGKPCEECGATGVYDPAADRRFEMGFPFPIYMIEETPTVPGSVTYPLDGILASYGKNAENVRYFTNSFGYMVALALHLGVKRIEAYGFEMSSKTEYGQQKPNANFWAGIAIGKGVEFFIPEGCTLLAGKETLYGYEKVPGMTSMHSEIQVNALEQAFQKAQGELNHIRGQKVSVMNRMRALQKGGNVVQAAPQPTE
jgi:hypothetical protein